MGVIDPARPSPAGGDGRAACCGEFGHGVPIKGLPATLTVSTTGDPVTRHEGGNSLAKTLGGSLLTVEGSQHGAAPRPERLHQRSPLRLPHPSEGTR
ncbi:alpha/beta hydrolase [Streptomyces sp. P9(2023)]|uniref:alpha/beta hydrolase n=1 Tax=Streptomyces sp. P9(2023) TaxID=3064394 RepID=UPI0037DDCEDD